MNWQEIIVVFIAGIAVFYLVKRFIFNPDKKGCDNCNK